MIPVIATAVLMIAGVFVTQVLRSVDLPKYRATIFKVSVAMALLGGAAAGWGATREPRSIALLVVGASGVLVFGQRAWHYHAIRREIDIPPHLTSTYDPKLEGPAAQSAKKRASRTAGGS